MSTLGERALADAGSFLNEKDFALRASFTPVGGSAKWISVDFLASWQATDDFGMSVENATAVAYARAADVTGAESNSTLTINAVTYYLLSAPQLDGHGLAVLYLSKDQV